MKAVFTLKYDCKHSRRYGTDDEEFPIKDVYVQRPFSDGKDKIEIEVTVPSTKPNAAVIHGDEL